MPKKANKLQYADASNYDVGYAKPPVKNRFQSGQSGNPKGRPKKAKSRIDPALEPTHGFILDELYRPVRVREGGRAIEMPAMQIVMRTLVNDAMAGKATARKLVLQLGQAASIELQNRRSMISSISSRIGKTSSSAVTIWVFPGLILSCTPMTFK